MKYRDNVEICLANSKEVTESDDNNVNEMSVGEWLDRLNLSKYQGYF